MEFANAAAPSSPNAMAQVFSEFWDQIMLKYGFPTWTVGANCRGCDSSSPESGSYLDSDYGSGSRDSGSLRPHFNEDRIDRDSESPIVDLDGFSSIGGDGDIVECEIFMGQPGGYVVCGALDVVNEEMQQPEKVINEHEMEQPEDFVDENGTQQPENVVGDQNDGMMFGAECVGLKRLRETEDDDIQDTTKHFRDNESLNIPEDESDNITAEEDSDDYNEVYRCEDDDDELDESDE